MDNLTLIVTMTMYIVHRTRMHVCPYVYC